MKAFHELPGGYREILEIDLRKDRKTALTVNLGAAAVTVLLIAAGAALVPLRTFFRMENLSGCLIRLGVLLGSILAYTVLHELTHGAVMKAAGGGRVRFGFTGGYAFAGSLTDYFDRTAYLRIALAPLILWGVVLGVLSAAVPEEWFWNVWLLQAVNAGGAAGDVYVAARVGSMRETVLVRDTGVKMTVFDRPLQKRPCPVRVPAGGAEEGKP